MGSRGHTTAGNHLKERTSLLNWRTIYSSKLLQETDDLHACHLKGIRFMAQIWRNQWPSILPPRWSPLMHFVSARLNDPRVVDTHKSKSTDSLISPGRRDEYTMLGVHVQCFCGGN